MTVEIVAYEFWVLVGFCRIQLEQIGPWWLIGLLAGSVIAVFGSARIAERCERLDQSRWGLLGIVPAALLGIASPLCLYGTIPLVAALARKKLPQAWLTSFMMSSILLNPQLLIYTAALGLRVAVLRFTWSLFAGIIAGGAVWFIWRKKQFYDYIGFAEKNNRDIHPNPFLRLLFNIGRAFRATGPYFALGILLTALFERYVPKAWVSSLFGVNKGWGVLLGAALGVPMYVCGGATIPLLGAWMQSGMSLGSAMAFMITGQAIKFTNLSGVKIILGKAHFALYVIFVLAFSLLAGFLTDSLGLMPRLM
jgi:uncharacterized protein